jgi:outer membrane lipoprotein-sorting protein
MNSSQRGLCKKSALCGEVFVFVQSPQRVKIMSTTLRSLALVIAILLLGSPAMAQAQRKIDATRILDNMYRAYSRLASYQDEGTLITTNDEPTGGTIEKMPFKTFFRRPDLFRFEWTDYGITKLGRSKVIWFNGKEAFMYWEPDLYEKQESLSMAVAGATGISLGTVKTVSDLMLPGELDGSIFKRLTKVLLAGEDVFEGVACYRIKATERERDVELWVGKNDFLLRKLRQEWKSDEKLTIEEEIRRKIKVDQPVPEVVFNYKPPIELTPKTDTDLKDIDKLLNPGPPLWTEFRSEEGRFTVSMPQKPVSQASSFDTPQGRFEQHAFTAAHDRLVCTVAYTDLPKLLAPAGNVDGFFASTRDEFIKEVGGKLASETSISIDGHPGREIKVNVFRGELRVRMFLVGDRLYLLWVTTLDKSLESDTALFNKFFDSFKLNVTTKPIAVYYQRLPGLRCRQSIQFFGV